MSLALHLEQDADTWTPRFRKPASRIDSPGPGGPLPSIRGWTRTGAARTASRTPVRRTSRLTTTALVIYASLAVLVVLLPDPILDRLGDAGANPAADLARSVLGRVSAASRALGAQVAFDRARDRFLNGPFPPEDDYRLRGTLED